MTTHALSRLRKLTLLTGLYFSQGLPFGFFSQALPVLLRKEGQSLEHVGLSSLLAAPWAFKFLWAPLVDRHGSSRFGQRRVWIIPLQLLAAALLFAVALYPPRGPLGPIMVVVFLTNLFAATQDIATDALAIDLLHESERGIANGIQVAGYRVGMIVGGGLILMSFARLGWQGSFAAMGTLVLVASAPVLALTEPTALPPSHSTSSEPGRHFFRVPGALRIIALLATYKFGDAFAVAMLRPMLVDRGFGLAEIGKILGIYGFGAGLVGALIGGALVNRFGRKPALLAFGALQALSVGSYALLARGPLSYSLVVSLTTFEHLSGGMATAALFTCMMDWSRPAHAATDYTVQASTVVVATAVASSLSGYSAHALGYAPHFVVATLLALAVLIFVAAHFPALNPNEEVHP